ncbi:MAG: hypothetical protein RR855_04445 [Comamonas sp.]
MQPDWTSWGPLALSVAGAVAGVAWGVARVWRMQRRLPPPHANARTARLFAQGFALAAVLWLAYGLYTGYARFVPADDRAWQLAVHASALWSVPLFISAIVWATSIAMGWVMRLLQREGDSGHAGR